MIEELLRNFDLKFGEKFEAIDKETGKVIGKYYFMNDSEETFKLYRHRKNPFNYTYTSVADAMTGNIILGILRGNLIIKKLSKQRTKRKKVQRH